MCSRRGSPISPPSIALRTRWKFASKRRLKPICSLTPARSTAFNARSIAGRSKSTGFSQKICLPTCAASEMICACVSGPNRSAQPKYLDAPAVRGNPVYRREYHSVPRTPEPLPRRRRQPSPVARRECARSHVPRAGGQCDPRQLNQALVDVSFYLPGFMLVFVQYLGLLLKFAGGLGKA